MEETILHLLSQLELGKTSDQDLVTWAVKMLEEGKDTESLVLLAGLTKGEFGKARRLFMSSVQELGYEMPSKQAALMHRAKTIANEIVEGLISPNDGCTAIGEIVWELGWPDELSEFGALAHEQTGHEHLGITAESLHPAIIEAARKLSQTKRRS